MGKGEDFLFFQGPAPKSAIQEDLPSFFSGDKRAFGHYLALAMRWRRAVYKTGRRRARARRCWFLHCSNAQPAAGRFATLCNTMRTLGPCLTKSNACISEEGALSIDETSSVKKTGLSDVALGGLFT